MKTKKPTKPQTGVVREKEPARSHEPAAPQADGTEAGWGWLRPEEVEATFDDARFDESEWAP